MPSTFAVGTQDDTNRIATVRYGPKGNRNGKARWWVRLSKGKQGYKARELEVKVVSQEGDDVKLQGHTFKGEWFDLALLSDEAERFTLVEFFVRHCKPPRPSQN